MVETIPGKTCAGCKWTAKKFTFLGVRPYCRLYKRVRDEKCIDYSTKGKK